MVERGIVKTRSQARMLIVQGDVYCNDKQVTKPGQNVQTEDVIEIRNRQLFVSRGAYKLEKALDSFSINPEKKVCADFGASTGGFTQLLIQRGASKVYAIDVGKDQLADELKELQQVINMEGVNLKYPVELPEEVELGVVDLSFISLKLVFENILKTLKVGGELAVLVKPQFEAGKENIGKNGLIKNEKLRDQVLNDVLDWIRNHGGKILEVVESPITGKTGNTEYLAHIIKE
jgi:23S rRNA (cytidine1920-2'-O)/16S rRNA (cytidine1409-2'-O)-methyltransferase